MKHFVFSTILILVIGVGFAPPVFALTVSPAKLEISGDPGRTLMGEIELLNEQDEIKTFYSSFENFESNGESGAPYFIGAKEGLATWIKTESQVTLKSNERKKFSFSIAIPKNAEPGGHFAAIFWGTQQPDAQGGGQVSVGGKLGILVLLRVSGEVKEGGGLLEFGVSPSRKASEEQSKDKQRFFSSLPITFVYRFNNTGGDRVVPQGEIKIKNLFGLTSATLPANKSEGSVLPSSARKFEVIWENEQQVTSDKQQNEKIGFFEMAGRQWSEFHFGWYTARMNLVYGATNQAVTAKYNFFIIPWQLLLIIVIILAIIGFLGILGLKKYNRWIIAKHISQDT